MMSTFYWNLTSVFLTYAGVNSSHWQQPSANSSTHRSESCAGPGRGCGAGGDADARRPAAAAPTAAATAY